MKSKIATSNIREGYDDRSILESLCDLLFEVSNEDRVRIVLHLESHQANVTGISKVLGLSSQETSRHVTRLSTVGLIDKNPEGFYNVSELGRLVLKQLSGLQFVTSNKGYFSTHSHAQLPHEFIARIGELGESVYTNDAIVSIYSIEKMVRKADNKIWSMNFPVPVSVFPLLREAFERGVNVRFLGPEEREVHPIVKGALRKEDRQALLQAAVRKRFEERFVDRMPLLLWMSDSEVGLVSFPKLDGSFDSLGFVSTDKKALKWCEEIFRYYWDQAPA